MTGFLAPFAAYVAAAYIASLAGLGLTAALTWKAYRDARRRLDRLQGGVQVSETKL